MASLTASLKRFLLDDRDEILELTTRGDALFLFAKLPTNETISLECVEKSVIGPMLPFTLDDLGVTVNEYCSGL